VVNKNPTKLSSIPEVLDTKQLDEKSDIDDHEQYISMD